MILITGSNGLIGRALLRTLAAHGHSIRAHTRISQPYRPDEFSAGIQALEEHRETAERARHQRSDFVANRVHQGAASTFDSLRWQDSGATASAAVIERSAARLPLVQHRQLDFAKAKLEDFVELVQECHTVIHTAALVHAEHRSAAEFEQINVEATRKLIQAANITGIDSFVMFSTSAVYGSCFENVAEEPDRLNAQTSYAHSKLAAEEVVTLQVKAPRTIVLRPSLVFGEGDRGNMLALVRQINKQRYANVSGNLARKSLIYSLDAAHAVRLCLEKLPPGNHLLNLSNPQTVGVNELSVHIAECLERRAPVTVPFGILRTAAHMAEFALGPRSPLTRNRLHKLMSSATLNVDLLVRKTGFAPQFSLKEALSAEIEWARQNKLV